MAKPASGTSLDTGHDLYTSLLNCWALLEGTGTSSVDSRSGNDLTLSSSGLWTTNGSSENIIQITSATASPLALDSAVTLDGSTDWSMAWRAKQATSSTNGVFAGDNTDTNDFLFFLNSTGFRFRNTAGGGPSDWTITGATTTRNYLLVYTQVSGTSGNLDLYENGSHVAQKTSVTGSFTLNTLGNGYGSTTFALIGDMEYFYLWDGRALDSTDASALNTDPYDFFDTGGASASKPVFQRPTRIWNARG